MQRVVLGLMWSVLLSLRIPELLRPPWEVVLRNTCGVCRPVSSSLISFCDIVATIRNPPVVVSYCGTDFRSDWDVSSVKSTHFIYAAPRIAVLQSPLRKPPYWRMISRIREIFRGHSTDYLRFTCKQSWSSSKFIELKYIAGNNLSNESFFRDCKREEFVIHKKVAYINLNWNFKIFRSIERRDHARVWGETIGHVRSKNNFIIQFRVLTSCIISNALFKTIIFLTLRIS